MTNPLIRENMPFNPRYVEIPERQTVVCVTQRAASNSMMKTLQPSLSDSPHRKLSQEKVRDRKEEGWKILMWIRDPFAKLASAHCVFAKHFRNGGGETFPKFVDAMMEFGDPHWQPQTKTHRLGDVFLPTKVYPFDTINQTWEREIGIPLERHPAAEHRMWEQLRSLLSFKQMRALHEYYEEDLKMYSWCLAYGAMEAA